jgi:hypothetical protein
MSLAAIRATPNPPRHDLPIEREEGASKGHYVVRLDGEEAVITYSRATGGDGLFYCFAVNE